MTEEIQNKENDTQKPAKFKRGGRQSRFLAQSVILEESGSSTLIRIAMISIVAVIIAFLGWAAITNVDEVAATSGEIVPTGQILSIQHLEGGIIKAINIQEGEIVEKDQVLIKLDEAGAAAELRQTRARKVGLDLQAERLRAVGTGREPDFSFAGKQYADLIQDQIIIYESQMAAREDKRTVFLTQIDAKKAELSVFKDQIETLSRNTDLLLEEFKLREELYKKGLATKLAYLDIKRQLNQARGDLSNLIGDRERVTQELQEVEDKLYQLGSDDKEQALTEMGVITNELAQVNESMSRLLDRVRRLQITSPVRGIVKGLVFNTVGGVIPPGAVIMEVVPLDKELVVETRITTRDVGFVEIGQPVTVKVTTYDFARFGGIGGQLKEISASTFLDENGAPYYKGVVTLDRSYVGFDPERNRVLPGMTVQADIKTGKKTLLAYLMKPVVSSISTSFRER